MVRSFTVKVPYRRYVSALTMTCSNLFYVETLPFKHLFYFHDSLRLIICLHLDRRSGIFFLNEQQPVLACSGRRRTYRQTSAFCPVPLHSIRNRLCIRIEFTVARPVPPEPNLLLLPYPAQIKFRTSAARKIDANALILPIHTCLQMAVDRCILVIRRKYLLTGTPKLRLHIIHKCPEIFDLLRPLGMESFKPGMLKKRRLSFLVNTAPHGSMSVA